VVCGRPFAGGYTLATGEPVVVDDLRTDRRFAASPLLLNHASSAASALPFPPRDRPFGVFCVSHGDSCANSPGTKCSFYSPAAPRPSAWPSGEFQRRLGFQLRERRELLQLGIGAVAGDVPCDGRGGGG